MKPLLAAKAELDKVKLPVFASAKLDGVRAVIIDGVVLSRALKPIPNRHVQALFGRPEFDGFDGELIVGSPTAPDAYTRTVSGVMSESGEPEVMFHLFDDFSQPRWPYAERLALLHRRLKAAPRTHQFSILKQCRIDTLPELTTKSEELIGLGYEGIMLRDLIGVYKFGRSTEREGILLKYKLFQDSEAVILSVHELLTNDNAIEINELGNKFRSTKKAGKRPANKLGALTVRDLNSGVEFEIGSGFTEFQRTEFWAQRELMHGKIVKYKYQAEGMKDKPRFPVFIGFRHKGDM